MLETIRDLLNAPALPRALPPWLNELVLGYGKPHGGHYRYVPANTKHTLSRRDGGVLWRGFEGTWGTRGYGGTGARGRGGSVVSGDTYYD